jgi:hypothetical protein
VAEIEKTKRCSQKESQKLKMTEKAIKKIKQHIKNIETEIEVN